jgi:ATP:ADP antiporter, AAA family
VQVIGAAMYVITRSAKFSLFKPAEEMVYLSLDARARLNGKAAVDVLGTQLGKSGGSVLQQALLILTAGSAMHSLPCMFVVFLYVVIQWGGSVDDLSRLVPSHTSLDSLDLEDEGQDQYKVDGEMAEDEIGAIWELSRSLSTDGAKPGEQAMPALGVP